MAITEIIRGGVILLPRDYLGLSTDIKPTTDSKGQPLAAGSSFNATDTGVNYRFDGVAWWQRISAYKRNGVATNPCHNGHSRPLFTAD